MIKHGIGKCVKPNGNQPARETDVLYVAIELAQDNTLFDYIIDQEPFAEGTALVFYQQLLKGLQAMYNVGKCHRDIKCENLLLDDQFNLKVADFGFAAPVAGRYADPGLSGALLSYKGTHGQIAPEIESTLIDPNAGYQGHLVDIFNSGIILFCMVMKRMPFERAVAEDQFYRCIVCDRADLFWEMQRKEGLNIDVISDDLKDLIFMLLGNRPTLRPTINEILAYINTKPGLAARPTEEQLKFEFSNRRIVMEKKRNSDLELAQQQDILAQYSQREQQQPHRGAFYEEQGETPDDEEEEKKGQVEEQTIKTTYRYDNYISTKFPIMDKEPNDVYLAVKQILKNYDPSCMIVDSKDRYKLKVTSAEQINYHPGAKAKQEDEKTEPLKKQVKFTIRLLNDEKNTIFVEFQKHVSSDSDMFTNYFNQVRSRAYDIKDETQCDPQTKENE